MTTHFKKTLSIASIVLMGTLTMGASTPSTVPADTSAQIEVEEFTVPDGAEHTETRELDSGMDAEVYESTIKHETRKEKDPMLPEGLKVTVQKGKDGTREHIDVVDSASGYTKDTKDSVEEIVRVGTNEEVENAPLIDPSVISVLEERKAEKEAAEEAERQREREQEREEQRQEAAEEAAEEESSDQNDESTGNNDTEESSGSDDNADNGNSGNNENSGSESNESNAGGSNGGEENSSDSSDEEQQENSRNQEDTGTREDNDAPEEPTENEESAEQEGTRDEPVSGEACAGWGDLLEQEFGSEYDTACRVMICESGGDTNAQNPVSSASGLFQFIDGTWNSAKQRVPGASQYPRASDAPGSLQIAVAADHLEVTNWEQWECY